MNFRSSHNQSVGKASIIQTYGLPCNDWNNIHSLEESANELRAKQRREGGGVAVPLYASEQDRGSKGVGESKPSPQPSPIGEGAFRHSEEASNSTRQIEFCINFSRHSEALRAERIQPIMVDGGQEVRRSGWYNKRTLTNYTNIVLNENSLPSCPLNFRSSDNQPFTLHHSLKRNAAFTLAEVLITLGIIGVVAALTMPSLIANHKYKVLQTQFKKAYSDLNQASKLFQVHNGISVSDFSATNTAKNTLKEFSKEFNTVLKNSDLRFDSTDNDGNVIGAAPYKWEAITGAMEFKSVCDNSGFFWDTQGRVISFDDPPANGKNGPKVCIDINGEKAPNRYGMDYFVFIFTTDM